MPRIPWDQGLVQAWTPGTIGATEALETFVDAALQNYAQGRDRPDHPGTSRLSPYLHFGEISPRQMREAANRRPPTAIAALAQNASRPVKGTTTHGVDIDADYAKDRARLEAFNRQLAEKNCRTFDIAAQLKPGNTETPRPVGEAKPKVKTKG